MKMDLNFLLGKFAVERGFISIQQWEEAKALLETHPEKNILQVLVQKRYLTPRQAENLWKSFQQRRQNHKQIGPYEILSLIGEGGMGKVFLARYLPTGEIRALKVLLPSLVEDFEFIQRSFQEGEILQKLRHPNIVQVFEVFSEHPYYCLAMEYVKGQSLKHILEERGSLPLSEAIHITTQIASALSKAHSHNIVHRDVKPENILIQENGVAKLTDFGLAKSLTKSLHLTQTGAVVGTPIYLSPEQALGQEVTPKSDIYSLAITFYHMLTGTPPFLGEYPLVLQQHIQRPLPKIPSLPKPLQHFLTRMAAKDPRRRPSSQEVQQTLPHLLYTTHSQTVSLSRKRVTPSLSPRRHLPLLLLSGTALLLLLFLFLLTEKKTSSSSPSFPLWRSFQKLPWKQWKKHIQRKLSKREKERLQPFLKVVEVFTSPSQCLSLSLQELRKLQEYCHKLPSQLTIFPKKEFQKELSSLLLLIQSEQYRFQGKIRKACELLEEFMLHHKRQRIYSLLIEATKKRYQIYQIYLQSFLQYPFVPKETFLSTLKSHLPFPLDTLSQSFPKKFSSDPLHRILLLSFVFHKLLEEGPYTSSPSQPSSFLLQSHLLVPPPGFDLLQSRKWGLITAIWATSHWQNFQKLTKNFRFTQEQVKKTISSFLNFLFFLEVLRLHVQTDPTFGEILRDFFPLDLWEKTLKQALRYLATLPLRTVTFPLHIFLPEQSFLLHSLRGDFLKKIKNRIIFAGVDPLRFPLPFQVPFLGRKGTIWLKLRFIKPQGKIRFSFASCQGEISYSQGKCQGKIQETPVSFSLPHSTFFLAIQLSPKGKILLGSWDETFADRPSFQWSRLPPYRVILKQSLLSLEKRPKKLQFFLDQVEVYYIALTIILPKKQLAQAIRRNWEFLQRLQL